MKKIYLDNSATSFPKAPLLGKVMSEYIENNGTSVNRGSYSSSFATENIVYETRELLCELFNFDKPKNVVFTPNITTSLNIVIKGLLKQDDHVIVSPMEHNAVMRPLQSLAKKEVVSFSRVNSDRYGQIYLESLSSQIRKNRPKAVIFSHVSNVSGEIQPIKEVGELCKENGIFFIVDSAQSAGAIDIDIKKNNISALCFTGHKSLLGPQGIGGIILNDKIANSIDPLIEGGTGSLSELELQPNYMPDKFEAGTPNTVGIYGLNHSLKYIKEIGIKNIHEKEMKLTSMFLNEIKEISPLLLVGRSDLTNRSNVVSIDFTRLNKYDALEDSEVILNDTLDNSEVSHILDKEFNIAVRSGLHCSPNAHKVLGTFPTGTVRFSFGYFNTESDLEYTVDAIKILINNFRKI
jgi:cysteine desulfurase family protein